MSQRLVLVRHAIAADRIAGGNAEDDAARPLTERGRKRFVRAARGLHRLGVRVELLLTSPWKRAIETGVLLAPIVAGKGERVISKHLIGSPSPALLSELAGPARIAVVGHAPWLGELVALLAISDFRHADAFAIKKGGAVVLDGEIAPGQMRIAAVLPPRVLRRIG